MDKLKRAVIKEELVTLTGDYKKAVVLNQMIYWSERVRDFDKFVQEEKSRLLTYAQNQEDIEKAESMELANGWIYKKAEELIEETMMGIHKSTMLKYLDELVKKGWLDRRRNPKLPLDKTYQYRVNLLNIQRDLLKLGYFLEGYKANLTELQNAISKLSEATSELENSTRSCETQLEVVKNNSKLENATRSCETQQQYQRLLTEITPKDYEQKLQQQQIEEAVVVVKNQKLFQQLFKQSISPEQIMNLMEEAKKHGKDLADCMRNAKLYLEFSGEPAENPIGLVRYEIQTGWDLSSVKPKDEGRNGDDLFEKYLGMPQEQFMSLTRAVRKQMIRDLNAPSELKERLLEVVV